MVLSYYLLKYPYQWIWRIRRRQGRLEKVVCYLGEPIDYHAFQPVQKYLPEIPIVANRKTRKYLRQRGIRARGLPCFTETVIMLRHAAYKFPEERIVKIGMRHGPYHFKQFISADRYNAFDLFLMTGSREVEIAAGRGVKNAVAVGFPKLDPLFDGTVTRRDIEKYKAEINLDNGKPNILFSATYDASGISAIGRWIDTLDGFTKEWNILVTVHPAISRKYIKMLRRIRGIYFVEDYDILPYLAVADVLVGDMSSLIAEFCALDRPIVTFTIPQARRVTDEIRELVRTISVQIDDVAQLESAVKSCLEHPQHKQAERRAAVRMMFDRLDGGAGRRAAEQIMKRVPSLETGML